MKKRTKYLLFAAVIIGLFFLNTYSERIKEAERKIEVSKELQEIGIELSHLENQKHLGEFLEKREYDSINPQNLEMLILTEESKASAPLLIYREIGANYTFHLDGHVSVTHKKP
jgi:hypothetical protein